MHSAYGGVAPSTTEERTGPHGFAAPHGLPAGWSDPDAACVLEVVVVVVVAVVD